MSELSLPDDELLSSYLDGELTAEELARLEDRLASDGALRDRIAAIRVAAALSASPVTPLTSTDADRLITAALAASTTATNVTDLAAAGAKRKVWPARIATVAAGVVALAIAVPALRAIDTGDDNDSAGDAGSAETSSFDDAPADDGDDATAADMAEESSLAPAATGGVAADDAAPNDSADLDVEATVADELGYSVAQLRLFRPDDGFDPLGDQLGDFESTEDLSSVVSETWSGYRQSELETTTTTADPPPDDSGETDGGEANTLERDEILNAARARLDAFALGGCSDLADVIIAFFDGEDEEVVAADYTSATAAGAPVAVGLFRLPGNEAVLLVIDLDTCDVRDARLN